MTTLFVAMADESDPVDNSEFVYRRIHPRFFDPALPVSVLLEAFRPNRNDISGLSVVRAQFAKPQDCLPREPAKAAGYFVARLAVSDLRSLGVTIQPEPISSGPPGHAVIPELSWGIYDNDRSRLKPILLALARLATNDIVHRPN